MLDIATEFLMIRYPASSPKITLILMTQLDCEEFHLRRQNPVWPTSCGICLLT